MLSLLGGVEPARPAPAGDGWHSDPPYQVLYSYAVPVLRVGGGLPGRISKLFGDRYLWLRIGEQGAAFWSEEEGD